MARSSSRKSIPMWPGRSKGRTISQRIGESVAYPRETVDSPAGGPDNAATDDDAMVPSSGALRAAVRGAAGSLAARGKRVSSARVPLAGAADGAPGDLRLPHPLVDPHLDHRDRDRRRLPRGGS